jgi:hypothetical protein
MYYFLTAGGAGHVQSLVVSSILIIIGFLLLMLGLIADIISFNRRLIEDVLYRVKKIELDLKSDHENTDEFKG